MATVRLTPITRPFYNVQTPDRRVRLPAVIGRQVQPGAQLQVDLTHPGFRPLRAGATCYTAGADGRYWAVQEVRNG